MTVSLDVLVRTAGVAVGLVLVLVIATAAGWRRRADLILLIVCAVSYLACSAPVRPCCTAPAAAPLLMGAAAFPFAFWRLSKVVLEDDPFVPRLAWSGLGVLLLSAFVAAPDYLQVPVALRAAAAIANKLAAFGFVGAALWGAARSWGGDLLEPRRRLRWWLVGYLGAYGLAVMVGEIYLWGAQPPAWLDLLNALSIGGSLLATLLFLVQPRPAAMEALFAWAPDCAPATPHARHAGPDRTAPRPGDDSPVLARLHGLMEGEKLYRDCELSVATLAARAAVPEYVLRRLVNERLGYRNFAAYVNDFRLREVEGRLRDPQWARRPILTLALEAGFGSIGPFNRAFRERHGMTPTEFRNRPAGASGEASLA